MVEESKSARPLFTSTKRGSWPWEWGINNPNRSEAAPRLDGTLQTGIWAVNVSYPEERILSRCIRKGVGFSPTPGRGIRRQAQRLQGGGDIE